MFELLLCYGLIPVIVVDAYSTLFMNTLSDYNILKLVFALRPEEPNAKSAVGTQLPLLGRTSSVSGLSPYLPPPVAIEVPAVDDEAVKEVDNMM